MGDEEAAVVAVAVEDPKLGEVRLYRRRASDLYMGESVVMCMRCMGGRR